MLTLKDCLGLCELTESEIEAIAEHEHLPEIVAIELGQYLIHLPEGQSAIRRIIREDIADARSRGERLHASKLNAILRWFDHRCAAGRFR